MTLGPKSGPGERLALFKKVALVDSHSALLSGTRLIDTMIVDLEYNQGRSPGEAKAAAMEVLARLGLADLAMESIASLDGPEHGLAVMALALCRKAPLLVLDRPRSLVDDQGLALLWPALAQALKVNRAALVLDYSPAPYPEGLFAQILSLSPRPSDRRATN
jgi:ABC-type cobalamin/Fe3+-siderophores transport system ATPase subunit